MLDFLLLIGSLALLLGAARYFVDGVSGLAASLGVPQLVIGMTVVAFGTSTPELVVNGLSSWRGSSDLAFGNVVGSCIVNVGFVLALTALICPLKVEPSLITREIPMLLVATAAIVILGNDVVLDGGAGNRWGRTDGLILLLFFSIFLYYTARQAISVRRNDVFVAEVREQSEGVKLRPVWQELLITGLGLVGVSLGAHWTVEHAVVIARGLGISEAVIGLTVISLGTTLPELTTCVLAARQGKPDIAVGNIVGSNIFNLLCIGGMASLIRPVPIPGGGLTDLLVMAFLSAVLFPVAIRSQRTITRGEGSFLMAVFLSYLMWRVISATA